MEELTARGLEQAPDGPAVVYFYPANFTNGCTLEARGFNDLLDEFRAAGVAVVGVSTNDAESHRAFAAECGLGFPLVADADQELTTRLGLLKDYGDNLVLARRTTFLLDRDGTVRRLWDVKDSRMHAAEVLEAARELAGTTA